MNHLVIGAALPFVAGLLLYVLRNRRIGIAGLVLWPLGMFIGMILAVLPDVPRVLGYSKLYSRLSQDHRCDIFFRHYSIDQVESDTSLFAIPLVFMCGFLLFVAYRELSILEREV